MILPITLACFNIVWILTPIGWIVSMIVGFGTAFYMDHRRTLKGIRSQIGMICDDIEDSSEHENRDKNDPRSVEAVWERSLPEIRRAIYQAIPFCVFRRDKGILLDYWKSIKTLDTQAFYDRGVDEVLDRVLYGKNTVTKKAGLAHALREIERHI
jgi:hypothetical protein